jgi:minor extracellular protease Epr
VVLNGEPRRRLPNALVTVMTDEGKNIGVEGTTKRYGKATFLLSDRTKRVDAIYDDPLHSGWPMRVGDVEVMPSGFQIAVVPIDLAVADARGTVYGKPAVGCGKTVRVAVIDTGVGPHSALKIKRGLNTTAAESGRRFQDQDGHGSHAAGAIASAAAGWRRGEATAASAVCRPPNGPGRCCARCASRRLSSASTSTRISSRAACASA